MTQINIKEKWINAEVASFKETINPNTGKKEFFLETIVVPFNKISRNGVKYNESSVVGTHKQVIGRPLMHNHVLEGKDTLPRGEWVDAWVTSEAMHARAIIYPTAYNNEYLEYLSNATSPRVSLQITGDAEQKKNSEGKYYQEAKVIDWLEISTVNVAGFDEAKASFAIAMTEAFNGNKVENIKPGKYKTKGGETITVHSVTGNKAVISGDDSKNKTMDLDALKGIIGKESVDDCAGCDDCEIEKAEEDEPNKEEESLNKEFFQQMLEIRSKNV